MQPDAAPRVLVADDQRLVRSGFRLILNAAGIPVVAEAADGKQAVAAALEHRPDVVLMDIRMPEMDGLEATGRILVSLEDVRIIILTTFDLDQYVYAALSAGASGFLLKDVSPEHLSPPSAWSAAATRCSPRPSPAAWSSGSPRARFPGFPGLLGRRPGGRTRTCPPSRRASSRCSA